MILKTYNRVTTKTVHVNIMDVEEEQFRITFYWRDNAPEKVKSITHVIVPSDWYNMWEENELLDALDAVEYEYGKKFYHSKKQQILEWVKVAKEYAEEMHNQDMYDYNEWHYNKYMSLARAHQEMMIKYSEQLKEYTNE